MSEIAFLLAHNKIKMAESYFMEESHQFGETNDVFERSFLLGEDVHITYSSIGSSLRTKQNSANKKEKEFCKQQSNRGNKPTDWPFFLCLVIKMLGLWFPYNPPSHSRVTPTTAAKVITSAAKNTDKCGDLLENEFMETFTIIHKNGDDSGDDQSIKQNDTGCSTASVAAFIYLVVTCGLLLYDFGCYLDAYWGVTANILHLVSYFTFLLQVLIIPSWCLYTRIRHHIVSNRHRKVYPLSIAFIARCVATLGSLGPASRRVLYFRALIFILWPLTNAVIRLIYDYSFRNCLGWSVHEELSHWAAVIGYLFYGSFCYVIFIERISFESEVRQIVRLALEQASSTNITLVRARICLFYKNFNVLREHISNWMAFTMIIATWGLTAHVNWNYLIFNNSKIMNNTQMLSNIYFLNLLVTSQKVMFFFLPCIALGGLNLEHVWKKFKQKIAQYRDYDHEIYWLHLYRYMVHLNVEGEKEIHRALIFSAIGFYLGLNLGSSNQNLEFWKSPANCNATVSYIKNM